jgi:glycosyltransferase involved in cell wall biosynthesis
MTTIKAVITTLDNLPVLKEQIRIMSDEPLISEIIVVNNGSRDGTREWLETQSTKAIALHLENRGAGPGRNAGLDRARKFDYVLLLDGGIRPINGGVEKMLAFLETRREVDVIGFDHTDMETNRDLATVEWLEPISNTYRNTCLSETAYCLARARAFDGIRFCEEGPFAEPGWGVDDDEMAHQWYVAGIVVHVVCGGIHPYRRAGGSFQRLFEETGIWPNQYGSTYEKRLLWCRQNWPQFAFGGQWGEPWLTVIVRVGDLNETIRTIKYAHDRLRERRLASPWEQLSMPYSVIAWCLKTDERFLEWA